MALITYTIVNGTAPGGTWSGSVTFDDAGNYGPGSFISAANNSLVFTPDGNIPASSSTTPLTGSPGGAGTVQIQGTAGNYNLGIGQFLADGAGTVTAAAPGAAFLEVNAGDLSAGGSLYLPTGSKFNSGDPTLTTGPNGQGAIATSCFLAGTVISTPEGEVLIEDLNIGDTISTADGDTRKVVWLGKKTLSTFFTPAEHRPVLISAGALGNGLPKRDLKVMPAHAFLIGDVLVVAGQLVNGTTIRRMTTEECTNAFTYYAIETEDHCLILAEGAAVETKGNIKGNSGAFDNWSEYVTLYGEEGCSYPNMSYPRYRMVDELPHEIWNRVDDDETQEELIRKTA